MAMGEFYYGIKANFDALQTKNSNALYFLTDTRQIFKGDQEYTKSCRTVRVLPTENQLQGVIYVRMTDMTFHIWDGAAYIQLNKEHVTVIPDDPTNDTVPTTKAVADYVNAKIAASEDKEGHFVTDVTYKDGVLSVSKNGDPIPTTLTGVVHAPTYDPETRTIKMPVFGGDELSITLGKDLVVKSGVYSNTASAVDSGYVNSAGTSNSCTGNAATATGVKDYGDTNKTIKIGYAGAGLTTSNLTHIAGYASNGTQIKDVSKTVLQDWIDLNGMINKLSEATADPQDNDYYISQYSGGGTTTTTYHRRPIKALWNYIKGKTDAAYLKLTGGTISGALHLKQPNSGSYNENIRMHPSKSDWSSIVMCGSDNTGDSGTSAKTWGIFTNGGKFGISKNGNGVSAVGDASLVCGDNNVWKANGNELITSATIGSQTVSKANSATTASKLGTNAGSTTNPVYFKDGVPVAGTYTLSDASTKTVRTLTAQGPSGWKDAETDQKYVPDMAFMAYWNGAYSGTSSNLQYCDRGRFGTIITKGSGDYLPIGGGTLTGDLKFSDIGDTATSHKISWAGSTDGADIYYQTTAEDQGNLVLNLRDDTNCYLRIASNGAFKSYFSPGDGNFHGNVNGNATGASGYTFKSQTSDPGANSSLATGTVLFVYE